MVQIEKSVLIGMGVTINLGVKIGEATRIGNGATIKGDVPPKSIIRAGTVWPD
jgi:acetyltransferase-like isoleucine patch superfamily enzyme